MPGLTDAEAGVRFENVALMLMHGKEAYRLYFAKKMGKSLEQWCAEQIKEILDSMRSLRPGYRG